MKFKDTSYGDLTGKVYKGNINISGGALTSLEGAPKEVTGHFYCGSTSIVSLHGAPHIVGGNFACPANKLTSLKGGPQIVNGVYSCSGNKLVSLEGAPKEVGGDFHCDNNPNSYLQQEWDFRQKNPTMTEKEIMKEMYKLTNDTIYLPDALKKVFLIKDKK